MNGKFDMQLPFHHRVTLVGQQLVQGSSSSAGMMWPKIVQPLATTSLLQIVVAALLPPPTPLSLALTYQLMEAFAPLPSKHLSAMEILLEA